MMFGHIEILHFIGLCGDNLTHPDLIDILVVSYNDIKFNYIYLVNSIRSKLNA